MSELLAPAGNLEKLETVYRFGADAAYIGLKNFSLRKRADNFFESEASRMTEIKGGRKLYGALNILQPVRSTDLSSVIRESLSGCKRIFPTDSCTSAHRPTASTGKRPNSTGGWDFPASFWGGKLLSTKLKRLKMRFPTWNSRFSFTERCVWRTQAAAF